MGKSKKSCETTTWLEKETKENDWKCFGWKKTSSGTSDGPIMSSSSSISITIPSGASKITQWSIGGEDGLTKTSSSGENNHLKVNPSFSCVRVRKCKHCRTEFMMGDPPRSYFYKPCICLRSDTEWKKYQRKSLMMNRKSETKSSKGEKWKRKKKSAKLTLARWATRRKVLGCRIRKTWHGICYQTRANTFYRRYLRTGFGLKRYLQRDAESGISYRGSSFSRVISAFTRMITVGGLPPRDAFMNEAMAWEESDAEVLADRKPSCTIEYENEGFQFGSEQDIRKRAVNKDEDNSKQNLDEELYDEPQESRSEQKGFEYAFAVGSTSALVSSMISFSCSLYFVAWITLYAATLNEIIPDMKSLHFYITISSLVLAGITNYFRYIVSRFAFNSDEVYVVTGCLALLLCVTGLTTSLLITEIYSVSAKIGFRIIITGIMVFIQVSEIAALIWHRHVLTAAVDNSRRKPVWALSNKLLHKL